MTPEFSRPVRLDEIGDTPRAIPLVAEPAELALLARRFGLLALDALGAELTVRRVDRVLYVEGRVAAAAMQACVATAEPVPAMIAEPVSLRFEPAREEGDEEIELSDADLDVVPYQGGAIDLGEAVAQTLALALDPFPRAAGADARLRAAGVVDELDAVDEPALSPFAALQALKDKLGGAA